MTTQQKRDAELHLDYEIRELLAFAYGMLGSEALAYLSGQVQFEIDEINSGKVTPDENWILNGNLKAA